MVFAIMGITGRVGGTAANLLLAGGHRVRAVVREEAKGAAWLARGAEVALADAADVSALTAAFTGVEGVFIMVPPNFAPLPGYPDCVKQMAAVRAALQAAQPPRVVALSSIGGQQTSGLGLIEQCHIMEESLGDLGLPTAFLRAGWFMENAQWDIAAARATGIVQSQLAPLDRSIPMVATPDIGKVAFEVLTQPAWRGVRAIEVSGPQRYSPNDLAAALTQLVGREVRAEAVPRADWERLFVAAGMPEGRTGPRCEMIEGFNSGWIEFGVSGTEAVTGTTTLVEALRPFA